RRACQLVWLSLPEGKRVTAMGNASRKSYGSSRHLNSRGISGASGQGLGKSELRRAVQRWFESLEERRMMAMVAADEPDYHFGETALITGAEFVPNETVDLQVLHVSGTPGSNDDPQNQVFETQADSQGNITTTWLCNDPDAIGASYTLTARGMSSGDLATTNFTDSLVSISITSPTTASPATINSLPQALTVNYLYT